MSQTPLRIGLLLNSDSIPSWVEVLLSEIQKSNYATIALRVYDNGPTVTDPTVDRSIQGRIIMKLATKFHHRFLEGASRVQDAFVPSQIPDSLTDVDSLQADTQKTQWRDTFTESDLDTIRSYDLDVLIRIGFRILEGPILDAARYGVWSLHHGDNRNNRGGPPAFWETMQSWDSVGSILQKLTPEIDNGLILSRGQAPVDRFSLKHTRNNLYWKSQSMVTRELERLYNLGPDAYFSPDRLPKQSDFQFYSQRLFKYPTPREYLKLVVKKFIEKARYVVRNKRYIDQWVLLYHFSDKATTSPRRFKTLLPPIDMFWADPFVIERNGKYYIYMEEYPYQTKKGHISVIEMDAEGNASEATPVVVTDYHLSYPFLLEHEGELYMIPESVANNSVELYRCTEFPYKWEFEQNLMSDIQLVDATLFFKDGFWWLFGNQSKDGKASRWDECNLFYTKDFKDGNWQPHPYNPISMDVRESRPAGAIFEHEGKLYRPTQNCGRHYGFAFNMSEILTMDTQRYEEAVMSRVRPKWDDKVIGTHTFNRAGRLTVIDAIRLRKRR